MLCSHGCGQEAIHYIKYKNTWICATSANKCPVVRAKKSIATAKQHAEGRTNTDFGGRKNWAKGLILITNPEDAAHNKTRKNILISERGYKCEKCQLPEWQGQPITLELDHIDGIKKNNTRDNLRLLCPNCHAQTPTWRKKKSAL